MRILKPLTLLLVLFIGLSSSSYHQDIEGPVFKLRQPLPEMAFTDQFGKTHEIEAQTQTLIVALDKEPAHAVNEFMEGRDAAFLEQHQAMIMIDVSAAPSIIQKLFILPGLKKFEYPVLIFTEEERAQAFREGVNTEKVLAVSLENRTITAIEEYEPTAAALSPIFK